MRARRELTSRFSDLQVVPLKLSHFKASMVWSKTLSEDYRRTLILRPTGIGNTPFRKNRGKVKTMDDANTALSAGHNAQSGCRLPHWPETGFGEIEARGAL